MTQLLILLAVIPLACLQFSKKLHPKDRWLLFGVAFGTVISPASYGLMAFTSMPVIGKLLGLIGLLAEGATLQASQLVMIHMVNALIWSSYYGMIGYKIGQKIAGEAKEPSLGIGAVRQGARG